MTPLPPLLQAFFTERLARQRDASPHTIAAYRDSFRLLLAFLHQQTGKPPSKLGLEDLDAASDHRVPRPPGERTAATASGPATRA